MDLHPHQVALGGSQLAGTCSPFAAPLYIAKGMVGDRAGKRRKILMHGLQQRLPGPYFQTGRGQEQHNQRQ